MDIRETFRYGVEITKAQADENGDWIVEGIASTGAKDHEDDEIDPRGLDASYFLSKGFIKWEHSKDPRAFIGEPMEARVTKEGFYIKGRLYQHAPWAKQAVEALQTLEKSNAKRRLGFSIEGSVKERDPKNPRKVRKAILRNVAMTFNPVNDTTWARLAKSLSGDGALEFDLEATCDCGHKCGANCCAITGGDCCKSLSTASTSGQALMPESLEQDAKMQQALLRFLKGRIRRKKKRLDKSLDMAAGQGAFDEAAEGLTDQEAERLASFILVKSEPIDALVSAVIGGANRMPKEELEKSLDELMKAIGDETEEEVEDTDADDGGEGDEDETEKSFADELADTEPEISKAMEVSELISTLIHAVSDSIDGFGSKLEKSFGKQETVNQALVKALSATNDLIKSMGDTMGEMNGKMADQDTLIKSLTDKVEELANQPVGRKSVVNQREIATLQKSFGVNQGGTPARLTRQQIVDELMKGFDKGEIDGHTITMFETSGYLPPAVKERLGIAQ